MSGYRSVFTPISDYSGLGGVIFEIYQPGTNCLPQGTTYGIDVSYANGGAFSSPHIDSNQDGYINSGDTSSSPPINGQSGNAVGFPLGSGLIASPVVVCNQGACYMEYPGSTMKESGVGHSRTAWWEVH